MAGLPPLQQVVFLLPDGNGGTIGVTTDACTSEGHSLTNTITSDPVEEGSPITDHSRVEPDEVTLECVVSNTPIDGIDGPDYAGAFWQRLEDLHISPQIIAIQTIRKSYPSVLIKSVTSPVTKDTSNALHFTVMAKQVRIVRNRRTRVVVAKAKKAQPTVKTGKVITTQTPPEKSIFAGVEDGGAAALKSLFQ